MVRDRSHMTLTRGIWRGWTKAVPGGGGAGRDSWQQCPPRALPPPPRPRVPCPVTLCARRPGTSRGGDGAGPRGAGTGRGFAGAGRGLLTLRRAPGSASGRGRGPRLGRGARPRSPSAPRGRWRGWRGSVWGGARVRAGRGPQTPRLGDSGSFLKGPEHLGVVGIAG